MAVVMLMTAMVFTVGCKKDKNDVPGGGGDGADTREYVDLGLPSGLLWATCNIGAQTPEAYGNYFAWGESSLRPITNGAHTSTATVAITPSQNTAMTLIAAMKAIPTL